MKLDSVRELKQSLTDKLATPKAAVNLSALSFSARPMEMIRKGRFRTFALGIAPKGDYDYHLAIRIQRRSLQDSDELERVRQRAKGEVDERFVGEIKKRAKPWYQKRCHPLRMGCSIGHYKITAGTLGCFVKRRKDGAVLILSNNHVLANENNAEDGDDILQPGAYDGGKRPKDVIGALADFVTLAATRANPVDCAVCTIKDSIKYDAKTIKGLGDLAGLGPDFLDVQASVSKLGRTTGLTAGRVTAFELDNVVVGYDISDLRFDGQIEIEGTGDKPFSEGGDSGSLIVDKDLRAVGLLFAGGEQGGANGKGLTYANPIRAVLDALKVDLL
jgi:hypothetical protein